MDNATPYIAPSRRTPCAGCGKTIQKTRTSASKPHCLDCRRARPTYRTRPAPGSIESWDCTKCGQVSTRPATKGQRPKLCTSCRDSYWIAKSKRLEIYRRDAWTCWLCEESVDSELIGSTSSWRPSLDHVIPRSHGGSDSPGNLRLAHFWCNVTRRDDRYAPEDFRVSSQAGIGQGSPRGPDRIARHIGRSH